jgi:hypothetical protein
LYAYIYGSLPEKVLGSVHAHPTLVNGLPIFLQVKDITVTSVNLGSTGVISARTLCILFSLNFLTSAVVVGWGHEFGELAHGAAVVGPTRLLTTLSASEDATREAGGSLSLETTDFAVTLSLQHLLSPFRNFIFTQFTLDLRNDGFKGLISTSAGADGTFLIGANPVLWLAVV